MKIIIKKLTDSADNGFIIEFDKWLSEQSDPNLANRVIQGLRNYSYHYDINTKISYEPY